MRPDWIPGPVGRPKAGSHISPARIPRKREQGWVIDRKTRKG